MRRRSGARAFYRGARSFGATILAARGKLAATVSHRIELVVDQSIHAALRERSVLVGGARRQPGENRQTDVDVLDREDAKRPFRHGVDDAFSQHEVLHVRTRNQHTLITRQTAARADVEKSFDFLVHATDRLHVAVLVHGPRHREILPDWDAADGGQ